MSFILLLLVLKVATLGKAIVQLKIRTISNIIIYAVYKLRAPLIISSRLKTSEKHIQKAGTAVEMPVKLTHHRPLKRICNLVPLIGFRNAFSV